MDIRHEILPSGATLITLTGRLDILGAGEIDLRFSALIGAARTVVVDMAGVEFLASMGLRTLMLGARNAASKRGRLVLWRPSPMVAAVVAQAGVSALLPIVTDLAEAEALVMG